MTKPVIGFAICGSFCTFSAVIPQIRVLVEEGYSIIPIMSETAYETNTRFGQSADFIEEIEKITGAKILHSIVDVEPIGPKKLLDLLIIEPATGNTLAKLANGIADTSVTLAAKAHLRNGRPILLGISTNDAMAGNAQNIGKLLNTQNYYFIPFYQDNHEKKPNSVIANFSLTSASALFALDGKQIQPLMMQKA